MKKLLFFLFLSIVSYTSIYAQDPIVIKQDSSVRDLDEEQDVRDLPFRQRIRIGGGIGGLQFGNPTLVGVSPMVGYQVTNDFTAGLAVNYQYLKYSGIDAINSYGPRLFGQYRLHILENILSKAFAQAEVQKYYGSFSGQSFNNDAQFLAGLGIGFGGFQITVLYNFSYVNTNSNIYTSYNPGLLSLFGNSNSNSSPIVIRVGGFFF